MLTKLEQARLDYDDAKVKAIRYLQSFQMPPESLVGKTIQAVRRDHWDSLTLLTTDGGYTVIMSSSDVGTEASTLVVDTTLDYDDHYGLLPASFEMDLLTTRDAYLAADRADNHEQIIRGAANICGIEATRKILDEMESER
jgi:hypothetical protein